MTMESQRKISFEAGCAEVEGLQKACVDFHLPACVMPWLVVFSSESESFGCRFEPL